MVGWLLMLFVFSWIVRGLVGVWMGWMLLFCVKVLDVVVSRKVNSMECSVFMVMVVKERRGKIVIVFSVVVFVGVLVRSGCF